MAVVVPTKVEEEAVRAFARGLYMFHVFHIDFDGLFELRF
jgi:hypothetical protein